MMARAKTVGEMIAGHHWRDALERSRADDAAFFGTAVGTALRRFVDAHGNAWKRDTELGYRDDVAAYTRTGNDRVDRAWKYSDKCEAELRTLIERLMR
jgi:hypothetical protein